MKGESVKGRRSFDGDMRMAGRRLAVALERVRMDCVALWLGVVVSVDSEERVVEVRLDNGHVIGGICLDVVRNGKNGVVVFPVVGSSVVVGFVENRGEVPFVVSFTEVERIEVVVGESMVSITDGVIDVAAGGSTVNITDGLIELNGGGNGGLVLIEALTDKLNGLVDAFNGHIHTIPAGGVATAGSATAQSNAAPVMVPAVQQKADSFVQGDYENEGVVQ